MSLYMYFVIGVCVNTVLIFQFDLTYIATNMLSHHHMPRRGASNEYPQHMLSSRNKKDTSSFPMKKVPYLLL